MTWDFMQNIILIEIIDSYQHPTYSKDDEASITYLDQKSQS